MRPDGKLGIEESRIRRRGWIVSIALHLLFALAIAVEVSLKASTVLDPVFYGFCTPGILVGFPLAMLLGRAGGHGEGIYFGILFGLPFNVFFYAWLTTVIIRAYARRTARNDAG